MTQAIQKLICLAYKLQAAGNQSQIVSFRADMSYILQINFVCLEIYNYLTYLFIERHESATRKQLQDYNKNHESQK